MWSDLFGTHALLKDTHFIPRYQRSFSVLYIDPSILYRYAYTYIFSIVPSEPRNSDLCLFTISNVGVLLNDEYFGKSIKANVERAFFLTSIQKSTHTRTKSVSLTQTIWKWGRIKNGTNAAYLALNSYTFAKKSKDSEPKRPNRGKMHLFWPDVNRIVCASAISLLASAISMKNEIMFNDAENSIEGSVFKIVNRVLSFFFASLL